MTALRGLAAALALVVTPAAAWAEGWRLLTGAPTAEATLRAVAVDGSRVAVSGSKGTAAFSTDGGKTWTRAAPPGAEALDFRGVALIGSRTALLMSAGPAEQGQARIYRSTDGGRIWALAYQAREAGVFFDTLAFWNDRDGLVLSDPVDGKWRLLRTRDGGQTWTWVKPTGAAPAAGEAAFAASNSALALGSGGAAWIVSGGGPQGRVFRSSDFGETWTVSDAPIAGGATGGVFGALALGGGRGVIVGGDHKDEARAGTNVAVTTDGGATWTAGTGGSPRLLESVARTGAALIAVGPRGTAVSRDRGRTRADADGEAFHSVACSGGRCVAAGPKGRVAVWGR